jgi:hypothetical protein
MNTPHTVMQRIVKLGLILMMGVSMSACSDSWKEEVLLHDGQKIIVKRSQSFGGSRELGQSAPIKEQEISFTAPHGDKVITFKSEFSEDVGRANFTLLALHILNGTPYLIAEPNLCLSYNKWGRPNPPYVIFKHDGNAWQRGTLQELPLEFKDINLVINTKSHADELVAPSVVSAERVRKFNSSLTQPEYKTILREKISNAGGERCDEMVFDGKSMWRGIGWFTGQPSKEACFTYCARNEISAEYCPCNELFKGKK